MRSDTAFALNNFPSLTSLHHCACIIVCVHSQLGESAVEALDDTADEVALKLALWQGSAEFASLTESWRGCQFEALDLPAMEEAVVRFHKSTLGGRQWVLSDRPATPAESVPTMHSLLLDPKRIFSQASPGVHL
jgi:hypothetical protein